MKSFRWIGLVVFVIIVASGRNAAFAATAPGPNILVILVDDMGWRDTGVYGSRFYRTPHIDALAASGIRFTQAYAPSPLCSPTRASVQTGLYPARVGMTLAIGHDATERLRSTRVEQAGPERKALEAKSATRLGLTFPTLAKELQARGWATAHFGKWHLGWGRYLPANQGFDVAEPEASTPGPPRYFSPFGVNWFEDGAPGEHIDSVYARKLLAFIKANRKRRWFAQLSTWSVHYPYQARPDLVEKFRTRVDAADPQDSPTMGAMIESLDDVVGQVMDGIARMGLAHDTLVVFASDNGGYAAHDRGAWTSNLPLRGGKGQLYEGGVRVPLAFVWPGRIAPGSRSDAVVSLLDLVPTLLTVAGVTPLPKLDGVDLSPLWKSPKAHFDHPPLFFHFPHYVDSNDAQYGSRPSSAVRDGQWKLIRFYADADDQSDRFELYDLANDVGETRDLAAAQPDRVRQLEALLEHFLEETHAVLPAPNPAYHKPTP